MNKLEDNKTVIMGLLALTSLLAFVYLSTSSEVELFAQQQGTISVIQATALPLVNAEGNQVKLVINYSIPSESLVGVRILCHIFTSSCIHYPVRVELHHEVQSIFKRVQRVLLLKLL